MADVYVGTAAWNIPKELRENFSGEGSVLEKYAGRFNAVEINSSFYRNHKASTYARWRDSVPDSFRFSVKLSKVFTHEQRLKTGEKKISDALVPISELKEKWGALLVQLPPSLPYISADAKTFFESIRDLYQGPVVFEPRHPSWNFAGAMELMLDFEISRVIADPAPISFLPGFQKWIYYRLHGSPLIYKSNYSRSRLENYASELSAELRAGAQVWCIFDNTTFGFATGNALSMMEMMRAESFSRTMDLHP